MTPPRAFASSKRAWPNGIGRTAVSRLLASVPGVGLGAIALAATVTDPSQFSSGRQFAAWLG